MRKPQQLSLQGAANQFAARETLKRNLRHYDPQRRRLMIQKPLFHGNTRRVLEP